MNAPPSHLYRLYNSRLLLPDIAALALAPVPHLESVAKTLRERGVLTVGNDDLRVLWAEVLPAGLKSTTKTVVVVVVMTDGSGLTLYLN